MNKYHLFLFVIIWALLLLLNPNHIYAGTSEQSTAPTLSVEQRLAALEQKLETLQEQLTAEQKKTVQTQAALEQSQAELLALKNNQLTQTTNSSATSEQIKQMIDSQLDSRKAEFSSPEWVKNMQIKGDFRYRYELVDDDTKTSDRQRSRIRARLGIYGKASDEFDYGFRLASGNDEAPTTTNEDLGNSFSKKQVWLDLAYFDYHPASIPGLNILGGKIKNPYYTVGNSDLMFDTDVNPEGIAAKYSHKLNDSTELFAAFGGYYLQERNTEAETSMFGLQAGLKHDFDKEKGTRLVIGGGYYDYGNIEGTTLNYSTTNFFGNTSSCGKFASDFNIIQAFAEYGLKFRKIPVKIFADYAYNIACDTDHDTAFLYGFAIGDNKNAGDWQLSYNYRNVEADSIVGVLAERTFGGGGTDVKGHKLSLGYQISKNVSLSASYMMAQRTRNDSTNDYDTFFTDLVLKF